MSAPALTQYNNGIGVVTADMLNTFEQTCDNFSQLRLLAGLPGMQVFVRGQVNPNDGFSGAFYWNSTSVAVDDNNSVIAPTGQGTNSGRWLRVLVPSSNITVLAGSNATSGLTTLQLAINALDALTQPRAINGNTITPPTSPNNGDMYLVPSGATGVWASQTGNIAVWQQGAWSYFVPKAGWVVWNKGNNQFVEYNGTQWIVAMPPPIGAFGADPNGVTASDAAFINAGAKVYVPPGNYLLSTTDTIPGPFSWRKDPGATFSGAGSFTTVDIQGFNYNPDIRYISMIESVGTRTVPSTTIDPAAAFIKQTNAPDNGTGLQSPALYAQNNKWNTTANAHVNGIFAEAIDQVGGSTSFVEGGRFHGINTLAGGLGGRVYGVLAYAQCGSGTNDPNSLVVVGTESEVRRINGAAAPSPTVWTGANHFDACYLATVRGGVSPLGSFVVNPFGTVATQVGFLVPSSAAAQGTAKNLITFAAFASLEAGPTYGLYLRGPTFAAISIPNNLPIRAANGANTAENNLLYYSTTNVLILGAEASGGVQIGSLGNSTVSLGPLGYPTGAGVGGAVTQLTSRTTGVSLNTANGEITLFSTTTTAGQQTTFQLSNSLLTATDHLLLEQKTGAGLYMLNVTQKAAGLFNITVYTPAAVATAEAPVISFAIIKGSNT